MDPSLSSYTIVVHPLSLYLYPSAHSCVCLAFVFHFFALIMFTSSWALLRLTPFVPPSPPPVFLFSTFASTLTVVGQQKEQQESVWKLSPFSFVFLACNVVYPVVLILRYSRYILYCIYSGCFFPSATGEHVGIFLVFLHFLSMYSL